MLEKPERIPVSTYRLQLNGSLPFAEAARLAGYMDRLGVTECYCSPVFAAKPGSPHGYDICDHSRLNPELGGEAGFRDFAAALRKHNIGVILDFVPNHMAVDAQSNLWWRSVLENGPSSPFAKCFDIDWDPVKTELKGKVLLPVLGDQYGVTLDKGELQIEYSGGALRLRYYDLNLPLNPRQLRMLLRHNLDALEAALGAEDKHFVEFLSILFHLDNLPSYQETNPELVALRRREKEVAKQRLASVVEECPRIRQHIEENVKLFNGVPGQSRTYDLLHELLELQAYRLSFWRTAMHEINYRRFFDINELAGIRMEEPEVFAQAHSLISYLAQEGLVHGIRLDHVDGLFDPRGYFEALAETFRPDRKIYVVAEKILSEGEALPPQWSVHGTTGYDFLNELNGLFVDAGRVHDFRKLYARFTGREDSFPEVVYASKKLIISTSMASELNVLAHDLNRISESHRRFRDFTLDSLQEALREIVACFPVYRTYFTPQGWTEHDERSIDLAVREALRRNPAMEPSIFHFIRAMLLPVKSAEVPEEEYERRVKFAMKFQQYTGPVQAKAVEDTAFYRYGPLVSLNEVGGEPGVFGRSVERFHEVSRKRLHCWPLSMLATSTHDTKRGEDARARINVLSEIPGQWRAIISRWARANASARTMVGGKPAPDRGDEYLFYQALVGAWPADHGGPAPAEFVERMRGYMRKAVKEEKVHTSWINPSEEYDAAVSRFVERVLTGKNSRLFLPLFLPFQQRMARLGMMNSLSQLILKTGSPGVPDFYQGAELWDLSLVDPDNRRPVDFERRVSFLDEMEPALTGCGESRRAYVRGLLEHWEDGRIKLFTTAAGLRLRRRLREVFLEGAYIPLTASGAGAGHVIAFGRRKGSAAVIVVAGRLFASLCGSSATLNGESWRDTVMRAPTELPGGAYRNVLTEETVEVEEQGGEALIRVAGALSHLPATILYRSQEEGRN
jgi:(1->4)-alpha-D-glucan 1-alpha-D-glucosylmutase